MTYTYYCPTCNITVNMPACPRCKRPIQRVLRIMEPENLVEQLSLFDEEERACQTIRPKRDFCVLRGGKT